MFGGMPHARAEPSLLPSFPPFSRPFLPPDLYVGAVLDAHGLEGLKGGGDGTGFVLWEEKVGVAGKEGGREGGREGEGESRLKKR
jgi:hypothetical protein